MFLQQLPHISIVNKVDLLSSKKEFYELLDKHIKDIVAEHLEDDEVFGKHYKKLNHAIAGLVSRTISQPREFFLFFKDTFHVMMIRIR